MRKKRISHQESIGLKIQGVEADIELREAHLQEIEDTNYLFPNPELRARGTDTRQYEKELPILRQQLKSLEKYYKDKYGEG